MVNDNNVKIVEETNNGRYYRSWKIENPKAVILLVHGLGEHCQRYEAIAKALNNSGYDVCSMDLPNHGCSDGRKGHVDSFVFFQQAVLGLYQRIKDDSPNKPIFILGHSMGGLIVSHFLIDHQGKFKGAVLSGPAIETIEKPPAWEVWLIKTMAKILPKTGMVSTVDGSAVSRSPEVVQAYNNDPLVNANKLSAKLLVEFADSMDSVKQSVSVIKLPLLIMHGTEDQLTSPSGSQWLFDNVASKDKTIRLYEGLYHEIFNEPEGPKIYQEVIDWLDSH